MTTKSFAGRVGSKNRGQTDKPDLAVDLVALGAETTKTISTSEKQPTRPRNGQKPIQEDRKRKQLVGGFFDKSVKKQFVMLGVEIDKNQTELMAEALNDLFKKYNKPSVA